MNNKVIISIVVVIILILAIILLMTSGGDQSEQDDQNQDQTAQESTEDSDDGDAEEMMEENEKSTSSEEMSENEDSGVEEVEIIYTANGFTPANVTIESGTLVRFVNESGSSMWVASDVHPTHEIYQGTTRNEHCADGAGSDAFDQCETGNIYTFTFDQAGEWSYHNHVSSNDGGTIVVSAE